MCVNMYGYVCVVRMHGYDSMFKNAFDCVLVCKGMEIYVAIDIRLSVCLCVHMFVMHRYVYHYTLVCMCM